MLYLPRPRRHNIPGIPQHVTQRGNNRQACFFKGDDRQIYLELLHKAAIRRVCSVHAYVLMTNHVHLLLPPDTADGVSRLKIRYTNSKDLPLGSKSFLAEIESQLKLKLGSGKVGRPRKENKLDPTPITGIPLMYSKYKDSK